MRPLFCLSFLTVLAAVTSKCSTCFNDPNFKVDLNQFTCKNPASFIEFYLDGKPEVRRCLESSMLVRQMSRQRNPCVNFLLNDQDGIDPLYNIKSYFFRYCLPVVSLVFRCSCQSLFPRYKELICPGNDALSSLHQNIIDFTCRNGPGGRHVSCKLYDRESVGKWFECPDYGYFSGVSVEPEGSKVKCCSEPGLRYYKEDCVMYRRTENACGDTYKISPQRFLVGSMSLDNGLTWYNRECQYK